MDLEVNKAAQIILEIADEYALSKDQTWTLLSEIGASITTLPKKSISNRGSKLKEDIDETFVILSN